MDISGTPLKVDVAPANIQGNLAAADNELLVTSNTILRNNDVMNKLCVMQNVGLLLRKYPIGHVVLAVINGANNLVPYHATSHGPLNRYVQLCVAHAPGMLGTLYPATAG